MSVLRRATERRSQLTDTVDDIYGRPGYGSWDPGMVWNPRPGAVSTGSAMQLSAVWACLKLLSEAISTLPLDTFRREQGTRLQYRPRPDYLNFDPPRISRIEYLSSLMLSLLTDGNAFVVTPRDAMGVPLALIPLDPTLVKVEPRRGTSYFVIDGKEFTPFDIMHIKGMGLAGAHRGMSPISYAREVVDGARKAQEFGRAFLGNHAIPPAVLEIPAGNDPAADQDRARRIVETWKATHGGTSNAGKIGALTGGAKLSTVAVTPRDSQWMEVRRFGVQEIARIFSVPPHLIADSSNSTSWGSGLAEQNLAFGQFTLRPWIERIEDAHGRLLTTHGLGEAFVRLNVDALLRGATKDRYDAHAVGITNGFLTIDEARSLEDLAPLQRSDERVDHGQPDPRSSPPEDLPRRRQGRLR